MLSLSAMTRLCLSGQGDLVLLLILVKNPLKTPIAGRDFVTCRISSEEKAIGINVLNVSLI
jgi:hypothetical protein